MTTLEQMSMNETPMEVSLAGCEIAQNIPILSKHLGVCTSILSLDLSRSGIDDENGKVLASYLRKNNILRKLELEGNLLGPKTAIELGKSLKVNTGLKLLDLESNQLCADNGSDQIGLYEFVEFLEHN